MMMHEPLKQRHALYNMLYFMWVSDSGTNLHFKSWSAFFQIHALTLTGILQTVLPLSLLLVLLFLFTAGDVNEETSITNQSNYSN